MVSNVVRTSKYNVFTFIPLNLMSQFKKMANVYFLVISFMQMIESISISDGKSIMAIPLVVVIGVSMIKDAYEDYKRHQSDAQENEKMTKCL
jgi:phospholipid-transporting ATPase